MRWLPFLVAAALAPAPPTRDWVFVYYMSYDNNLEGAGEPILQMLSDGVVSDNVAVVVFADFRDRDGMRRFVLTAGGGRDEALLEGVEASGDPDTLRDCLDWTAENLDAANYAVVFLDHGGQLSESCYDEYPGSSDGPHWFYMPQQRRVLEGFREWVDDRVALVFFQQCGRGGIENHYEMRGVAPVVMMSQVVVVAPNYYYTGAIRAVCENPDVDGRRVARLIMDHETDDMFTTYTAVDGAALEALPERFGPVLAPLLALEAPAPPARPLSPMRGRIRSGVARFEFTIETAGTYEIACGDYGVEILDAEGARVAAGTESVRLEPGAYTAVVSAPEGRGRVTLTVRSDASVAPCYVPSGTETMSDAVQWLRAAYGANGIDPAPVDEFARWLSSEVLLEHRVSPDRIDVAGGWCGMSLMVPARAEVLDRYTDYEIYGGTGLDEMLRRVSP